MSTNIFSFVPFISVTSMVVLYGLGIAALIYFIKALRIYIRKNS